MRVLSEPTVEPISLELARKQCKVDAEPVGSPPVLVHEDDDLITLFIRSAREWCEKYTGLIIAQRTIEEAYSGFPAGDFSLTYGPVRGIYGVSYVDAGGLDQLVDSSYYTLHYNGSTYRMVLGTDLVWPTAYVGPDVVRVQYLVGYSQDGESPTEAAIPASIKTAMLLIIGHLYKNRSETIEKALENIPMGARSFLGGFRVRTGFA